MTSNHASYVLSRSVIAFVWFYHGLVPKLLGPHKDELAMNMALGLSRASATLLSNVAGILEIIFAFVIIVFWRHKWPLTFTVVAMIGLLIYVVIMQPPLLLAAFNPVTTNLCVLSLALVAMQLHNDGNS